MVKEQSFKLYRSLNCRVVNGNVLANVAHEHVGGEVCHWDGEELLDVTEAALDPTLAR